MGNKSMSSFIHCTCQIPDQSECAVGSCLFDWMWRHHRLWRPVQFVCGQAGRCGWRVGIGHNWAGRSDGLQRSGRKTHFCRGFERRATKGWYAIGESDEKIAQICIIQLPNLVPPILSIQSRCRRANRSETISGRISTVGWMLRSKRPAIRQQWLFKCQQRTFVNLLIFKSQAMECTKAGTGQTCILGVSMENIPLSAIELLWGRTIRGCILGGQ